MQWWFWSLSVGVTLVGSLIHGDLTRQPVVAGTVLFNESTAIRGNALTCQSCHQHGGHAGALALTGVLRQFPRESRREHRQIDLTERINECIRYSLDGRELPRDSEELKSLTSYVATISGPSSHFPILAEPPTPPFGRGAGLYQHSCQTCHGRAGGGFQNGSNAPPLWGPLSFTGGAGMARTRVLASFIRDAMPPDGRRPLSVSQAYAVAHFILQHPRPESPRLHESS